MMKDCCLGDEEKPPQPPSGEQALNLGFRSLKEYATLPYLEGVVMDEYRDELKLLKADATGYCLKLMEI
jgi:hypothetical protein